MTGKVLILGGNGRFGRHTAEAFWNAGWSVSLFARGDDLMAAARGKDVIVHGWNPAYPDWAAQVPRQTQEVICAARASGATVILAGNVYVYGEDAPEAFGPHLEHAARNPLGRIRVEMERQLRGAGIPLIVLRAGDFLDTEASGNWLDRIMAKSLHKSVLTYPGDPDIPHAWAFLPDMARAVVMLAERRTALPRTSDIAFPGYTLTGRELANLCGQALGRDVRVKPMAWWPLQLARPILPLAASLLEMRYLWNKPHHLARGSFDHVATDFTPTPVKEAIARAISPLVAGTDRPRPADAVPDRSRPQTA